MPKSRTLIDGLKTLTQADGGHSQMVGGSGKWFNQVIEPEVQWIQTQFFGHFVKLYLHGEAGLGGAVASLGTTWRLVGKDPGPLKFVVRYIIRNGL